MIHRFFIFLLGSVLVSILGMGACGTPAECEKDGDCPTEKRRCVEGRCLPKEETAKEAVVQPDLPPPKDCQDGLTRRCYAGDEKTKGIGPCKEGIQTCKDGAWGTCEGEILPQTEACDQVDNNCDGVLDEGCACTLGEKRDCYGGPDATKGIGRCQVGVQRCKDDATWSERCEGQVTPQRDDCANGIDDDCDGKIDNDSTCTLCKEGDTKECYVADPATAGQGLCVKGTTTCSAERFYGPCQGAIGPTAEVCDEKDNNCDGKVDEGCDCLPGKTRACYSGPEATKAVGPCKEGTQTCDSKGKWGTCDNEVIPKPEECNGLDDDCNGKQDDGLNPPPCAKQDGVCAGSTQTCQGSQGWAACDEARYLAYDPRYQAQETACDNVDNNCDGKVDDGVTRPCYGATLGCLKAGDLYQCTGECKAGVQACKAGVWGECQGEVAPQKELCDQKDDDCDGQIDNDCLCLPGQTRACYDGPQGTQAVGLCKDGSQTCVKVGEWGICIGAIKPSTEVCNGQDDDCNGQIDDGLTGPACSKSSGVCVGLRQTCGGNLGWIDCTDAVYQARPDYEVSEQTCDGKDNDCDGQIDESVTRPCYTGTSGCTAQGGTYACVGACKAGTQACTNGSWGTCQGDTKPVKEICANQIDEDCNGVVDDCSVCTSGQTRPCYTLPAGCTAAGQGFLCTGACLAGTQTCVGGQWASACAGEVGPVTESCNWQDDDCDGKTDEGGVCYYASWRSIPIPSAATRVAFSQPLLGVAVGSSGQMWRTTDGGQSWTTLPSPTSQTLHDIHADERGAYIAVGAGGTIVVSLDNGATFRSVTSGTSAALRSVSTYQAIAVAVGDSGTILSSKDTGLSWAASTSGTSAQLWSVTIRRSSIDDVLVVGASGTILRSTTDGTSWTASASGTTQTLLSIAWGGASSTAVAVGNNGTVLRSQDRGVTWTPVSLSITTDLRSVVAPGAQNFITAGSGTTYHLSLDDGATFLPRPYSLSGTFQSLALRTPTALLALSSSGGATGEGPVQYLERHPNEDLRSISYDNRYGSNLVLAAGFSGRLLRSTDQGSTWQRLPLPTATTIYGISHLSNLGFTALAVGTSGQILRSTDQGITWSSMPSPTTNTLWSVAVTVYQSSHVAVAVGSSGTLLRSTNGGLAWTSLVAPSPPNASSTLYSVTAKDNVMIAVGSSGWIIRSADGGQTWTRLTGPSGTPTLYGTYLYDSTSGSTALAVGSSGTIWRSVNVGSTWAAVSSGVTNTLYSVACDFSSAVAVGTSGTVLSSANLGQTWTAVAGFPPTTFYSTFRSYGTSNYVLAGSGQSLYRSTDYGARWSAIFPQSGTLNRVAVSGTTHAVAAGSGPFFFTADRGVTWNPPSVAQDATSYSIAADPSSQIAISVGSGGFLMRSANRGLSWTSVVSPTSSSLYGVAKSSSSQYVAVSINGDLLHSSDNGVSWTLRAPVNTNWLRDVSCVGSICVAVGSTGTILRSSDSGLSWVGQASGVTSVLYGVAMLSTSRVVAVGSSGLILTSSDGGVTWTQVASKPSDLTMYAVAAIDSARCIASDSTGRLFFSADAGLSWVSYAPSSLDSIYGLDWKTDIGFAVGATSVRLRLSRP